MTEILKIDVCQKLVRTENIIQFSQLLIFFLDYILDPGFGLSNGFKMEIDVFVKEMNGGRHLDIYIKRQFDNPSLVFEINFI